MNLMQLVRIHVAQSETGLCWCGEKADNSHGLMANMAEEKSMKARAKLLETLVRAPPSILGVLRREKP